MAVVILVKALKEKPNASLAWTMTVLKKKTNFPQEFTLISIVQFAGFQALVLNLA